MTELFCKEDGDRRADLLFEPGADLNAIDYLEVDEADRRRLHVVFLKPVPVGAYGLEADPARITVSGGTRIVGIRVLKATRVAPSELRVDVDRSGDFSPYVLAFDSVPELDPASSSVTFSFMASCPIDVDCRPLDECPPALRDEPLLDYTAKDYASFRQLLLDLLPGRNPDFIERNPADIGIALVELLAYAGDHLSYFQDAVANEAFLDTVRRRISARRHARLVDYRMHDGRNGWTAVRVAVDAPGPLPQGTLLLTRIARPLRHRTAPPGVVVDSAAVDAEAFATDPALGGVAAFETAYPIDLLPELNLLRLHTWGNAECCLPAGTREAYLYALPDSIALAPTLAAGDRIVLEEVLGPVTGLAADADPSHRQLVLLEEVEATVDPLYADTLVGGELQVRGPGQAPLPLLRVRWRRADALGFPLCLSARLRDGRLVENVSLARGNVVLADHGLTVDETVPVGPDLRLSRGPLTMECRPDGARYDDVTARLLTERRELGCDVREAKPAVALLAGGELWEPVPDLLDSPPFAQEFVAEVDDDGRALLRFGDGEYGRALPDEIVELHVVYRVGNERPGNVGAESIAHVALPGPAAWILGVRNPLTACGGVDPETIEEVRRLAPEAFRAKQLRAVTEADYAAAARELPEVAGAVASFRWTGSWWTVFVGVDPRDPADLVNDPDGFSHLSPALESKVRAFLTRYRLAGYDLEVRPPRFVPLELDLEVCAAPGYFRQDVAAAVTRALSPQRGFFDPASFSFGDPVYLSRIYAAIEHVDGVDSVTIGTFRRYGQADNGELAAGVLTTAPWEIARLDNDPSFVEHGVLHVAGKGGKA